MIFDDIFGQAIIPDTYEVLGVRLLPLTIYHVYFLKALNNPLVVGGDISIEHYAEIVFVCTRKKNELENIAAGDIELLDWDIVDKPSAITDTLNRYINDGISAPEYWEDGKENDRLRTPIEWNIVYSLLESRICNTEEDAWNYSLSKALCWIAVKAERNGSNKYIDPIDRKDMDSLNGC